MRVNEVLLLRPTISLIWGSDNSLANILTLDDLGIEDPG